MKRVILTGWNGFVGRNIKMKLEEDFELILIENDFIERPDWEKELEYSVECTDVILHIGAISDTTLQDSTEMLRYNYVFSKELFDLAQKYEKKVIYSSSAACYGDGGGMPMNIYGWSKLMAEQYGMAKCDDFVALRYFNVYGPGENHKGKMSSVALQSWNGEINKLFPKKPKRDFVYIDDVVSANIFAMINNISKGIFDVGSGEQSTFEQILEILDKKVDYHEKSFIPKSYQSSTLANRNKFLPEWSPKYSLEQGLKKYMNAMK